MTDEDWIKELHEIELYHEVHPLIRHQLERDYWWTFPPRPHDQQNLLLSLKALPADFWRAVLDTYRLRGWDEDRPSEQYQGDNYNPTVMLVGHLRYAGARSYPDTKDQRRAKVDEVVAASKNLREKLLKYDGNDENGESKGIVARSPVWVSKEIIESRLGQQVSLRALPSTGEEWGTSPELLKALQTVAGLTFADLLAELEQQLECYAETLNNIGREAPTKYPPAKPGGLSCEPLKAAAGSLRGP